MLCRAHEIACEFHDDLWLCRQPAPRFYPNAVTLSADNSQTQLRFIEEVIAILPGSWAVKDSFNSLNLSAIGFAPLFEASWICRAFSSMKFSDPATRWAIVNSADELAKWELAWNEGNFVDDMPRLFPSSLLGLPEIAFIAGYRDDQIVAGAIANLTENVVGLSNFFTPSDDPPRWWAGCVAMINQRFPGLSIVGYERGDALSIAQQTGFNSLAPLRVWLRNPSPNL